MRCCLMGVNDDVKSVLQSPLFSSNTFGIFTSLCCSRGPLLYFLFTFLTNVYPNCMQELGGKMFSARFSESPSVAIAEFVWDFSQPASS